MPNPILNLDRLRALSPSDRQAAIEQAARDIEAEIGQLKAGQIPVMYGHSRRYHLQFLYARREQLVKLARMAGCGDWIGASAEEA